MSDETLRELERAVEREGSASSRLRLAAELERVGRADDAVQTLLPVAREPAVRAVLELLRPLGTRDVVPVRECPRLLWEVKSTGLPIGNAAGGIMARGTQLIPSPQALVVQPGFGELIGLSPETGRILWKSTRSHGVTPWAGSLLALVNVAPVQLAFIDVTSGVITGTFDLGGQFVGADPASGTVLINDEGRLRCVNVAVDSRHADSGISWPLPARTQTVGAAYALTNDLVLLRTWESFLATRRSTGEVLWEHSGWDNFLGDRHGLAFADHHRLVARNSDGSTSWTLNARVLIAWLLSEGFLAAVSRDDDGDLHLIDRRTGEIRRTFHSSPGSYSVALCRDVVYVDVDMTERRDDSPITPKFGLKAFALDGRELWTLDNGQRFRKTLAFADRRIFVLDAHGTLTAYGPP